MEKNSLCVFALVVVYMFPLSLHAQSYAKKRNQRCKFHLLLF